MYLADLRGRVLSGKRVGRLTAVRADFDARLRHLSLDFPDGRRVADVIREGRVVQTRFRGGARAGRVVRGPWAAALSTYAGVEVQLVMADPTGGGLDRGVEGAVTLISQASLSRFAVLANRGFVDSRRFRMLIEVSGLAAHEEDQWVGRVVRVGATRIRIHGHVGRCVVITQSPDTGAVDLPALEVLSRRRSALFTEPLAFGVFGEVLTPGTISLGDGIGVVDASA